MNVPIVENWSDITGSVLSCRPSGSVAGFSAVEIAVSRVEPVDGFPNLLAGAAGRNLDVLVPSGLAAQSGLVPGVHLSCRVRRGGPEHVFVHRDRLVVSPEP